MSAALRASAGGSVSDSYGRDLGGRRAAETSAPPVDDHFPRLADPKRLAALEATGLLDSEAEEAFDRFTKLAARWLGMPIALVSLVDDHRQFFKSAFGLTGSLARERGTPLSHSFCQYAVSSREPLVVVDAREHPWLKHNLAVPELGVVAYAGVPLVTSEEEVLGAFCVARPDPHVWTEAEIEVLRDLATITMTEIELRSQLRRFHAVRAERSKEQRLMRAIVEALPDSLIVLNRAGEVILMNPAAKRHQPPEGEPASGIAERAGMFSADGARRITAEQAPAAVAVRTGEKVTDVELLLRRPGTPETVLSVSASPLRDEGGTIFAAVSIGRDVTAMREAERSLARSESILKGVIKHLPNAAVLLYDAELRYLMADGEQLLASIGLSRHALVGRTLREIATPHSLPAAEAVYRSALEGRTTTTELVRGDKTYALTTVPVRDDCCQVTSGLALIYDITTIKREEAAARREAEEVRSLSQRDELTGLYNRRGFLELARQQLSLATEMRRPALLFFVDLNGMKQINDGLGHEQGDRALVETAEVLRATFRGSDVIARLGGDEFVALLMDAGAEQLATFQGRVQGELQQRNAQSGRAFQLSASVGAAVFDPYSSQSIDDLLAKADALMYEQKKARKAAPT